MNKSLKSVVAARRTVVRRKWLTKSKARYFISRIIVTLNDTVTRAAAEFLPIRHCFARLHPLTTSDHYRLSCLPNKRAARLSRRYHDDPVARHSDNVDFRRPFLLWFRHFVFIESVKEQNNKYAKCVRMGLKHRSKNRPGTKGENLEHAYTV
jgi:hypothetical protein